MGDSIAKVRNQFNEYFQSLTRKQKTLIGLGSLFLVLTLALSIFHVTKPRYVPLYSGLSLEESGEITQNLEEMRIPYQSENGGTSVTVPKEHLNKARMNLAIEGFPQAGITWEDAFSSNSLTMTNDDKRKKYLQAKMNQLARTIEEINGIKKASVLLTVPDNSNFLTEDIKKSKASVLLTLKPGFELTEQEVNGMVMLIANAVEGLELNNISIHDNTGKMLNDGSTDSDEYSMNKKMDIQKEVKANLERSLRNFLAKIYGPDNVDIMLNVKLDFDREVTDIKEFAAPIEGESNGLVRSYQELKEQVKNSTAGGPPGTDSNSEAITQYNEIDSDDSTYIKDNKSVNYELNEIRKSIVKESGNIKDITVAIILNRKNLENGELTDEHKGRLIELVSAAAGLETKKVEVMARDFNESQQNNLLSISSEEETGFTSNIPLMSIGVIGLLLAVGSIFALLRIRRRKNEVDNILEDAAIEEEVEEIEIGINDKTSYKYQIEKFVDKEPEAVAQLLRSWLNED
ncbi:flagellar basal-body MS-ring/collar protein FliF [Wukongibacter sp. M2B1]|uniref:flagellar basal-body MS-ring/collar protein FliF n=1 Tax=Wukongibacter sp. M2B1 TaxID=3088895 RepID=UPI003D78E077